MSRERSDDAMEVVILCGGRGVRLRPMTDHVPKALVPVHGQPMLDHIIQFHRRHGMTRFTLCVGYLAERIRQHFDHRADAESIRFSDAGESASMLARLMAVRDITRERLLVVYGDTFINLDPQRLLDHHRQSGALATLVTAPIQNPFGVVTFDAHQRVLSFVEKPIQNHYIGCMVMERSAFDLMDATMLAQPDGSGFVAFVQHLTQRQLLSAFVHDGLQITFNTEGEWQRAERDLGLYYTFPEQT